MTSYVENETGTIFSFDGQKVARQVMEAVLEMEGCPYEASINVLLTDNDGIRKYNRRYRGIDQATDVLSFPNIEYNVPAGFSVLKDKEADCFDLDSGELVLGDIILSVDKVKEQADRYGHSQLREFAFLVTHSMLHLCGYDHMEEEDAGVMEEKQDYILGQLGITREK